MFQNRKLTRFIVISAILIALTAITATATQTRFAFIESVQQFFGMASVTTPTRTTAPTRLRDVSKTADLLAPATQPMFVDSVIAAWDFSGQSSPATFAATTFNADLVSTSGANNITRGAGAASSTCSNCFRTTGFQNNGISVANSDYFQITLGATAGNTVSLSAIDARFGGTASFFASPGVTSQFAYSLDGTNFTLIGSPVQTTSLTMTQINLTGISALQGVASGTTITLRYYASGQTTTGGWGFLSAASPGTNGLAITGSTASAATPTISLTPSTLHDFGNVNVSSVSSTTASALSGSNLTTTLTCSSSTAEFELSPDGSNNWSSSLGFTPTSGTVTGSVFIRFTPFGTVGVVNGNVTCSSTGATNAVRNLSGTGFSTLTVNKTGTGTGTVTSGDSAINCGATCSANYTSSVALVHMTATPTGGSTFTGWSGACTGVGACNFQMTANRTLTATFNGPSTSPGDHFRSLATGDWGTPGTWQSSANGTFSDAITATAPPTTAAASVTVQAGHVVTVTADAGSGPLTIAGSGGTVTANSGTTLTVNSSTIFNVQGTINGTGTFATTGNMTLSGLSGTFAAGSNLKVVSGTLTVQNNTIASNITIDAGAVLNTQVGGHTIHHSGNLTNNGTIGGASGTFNVTGSGTSFVNNGSVTIQLFTFNGGGAKTFSGSGTLSPTFLQINGGAVANLASNVNIGPTTFQIDASGGGSLTMGGFTATLTGTAFSVNSNGAVSGGTIRMQGTNSVGTAGAASFTSALNINTGTTTFTNSTISGNITVDNGATLNNNPGGHTMNHTGDLTNNGAIGGDGSFQFNGANKNFVNNGTVTITNFRFHAAGIKNLSGSGTLSPTALQINNTATVTLASDVSIGPGSFTVDSTGSGLLDLNGFTATLSGVTFFVNNNGSVTGGNVRMQNTNSFSASASGSFTAALNINTGTTTFTNSTVQGAITVDAGAAFNNNPGGHAMNHTGTLTNDGTIGGDGTYNFNGNTTACVNNGTVSISMFRFHASGNKDLSGSGTWTGSNLQINNNANVSLTSDVTVAATNFTIDASGGGTLNLNGFTLTLNGVNFTNGALGSVTGTGTFRTQGTTSIAISGLTFNGALLVNTGTATVSNSTISGSITVDAGATLNARLGGHVITHTGDLLNNGTIGGTDGAYHFNGTAKAVTNNGSISVLNFRFNAAGAKTLGGTGSFSGANPVTINNNATVTLTSDHQVRTLIIDESGTGSLELAGHTLKLNGPTSPIFKNTNGTFINSPGTVEFNGTAAQTLPTSFTNYQGLTINNAAGVTGVSGLTVTGTLRVQNGTFSSASVYNNVLIDAAGTLSLGGPATVTGNWTNNGAFTHNNHAVSFAGAGAQALNGNTTFHTLSITSGPRTITFEATKTQTATNSLTMTGTSGNLLTLRSSSPGTYWKLVAPVTQSVSFVNVQDSDATGPNTIMQTNSVDAGHNLNWDFPPPTTVASLNIQNANPTNQNAVTWTVEFATPVDGVTTGNFALVNGGLTGPSITSVAPQGSAPNTKWNVTVNTGTGDGTLGLNLANATGLTPGVSTTLPYVGQVYTVDKSIPTTPVITGSTPASPNNSSTAPTVNGTAEADVTVNIYTSSNCTTGILNGAIATGGNFAIGVTVSANATTSLYASAVDGANNVSPCSGGFSYTHDNIPAVTALTSTPPLTTTSTDATFEFSGTESIANEKRSANAPSAPGFTFECQLDGGGYSACTSPKNYIGLSVASHTFDVRATDPAGNTDATPESYMWEVLGGGPTMTTNAASAIGPTTATLNGEVNDNGNTATAWFRYSTTDPGTCNDSFGTRAPINPIDDALSTNGSSYSFPITGLTASTTYYFCAIGANSGGTAFGSVQSFTTTAIPCTPPSVVYVDDDWASAIIGTDPDGIGGPATQFGCDSFATIQGGINGVTAGGTVNVAAGSYPENVIANKSVWVIGNGQDLPTATLINPTGGGGVTVSASSVTLTGLRINTQGAGAGIEFGVAALTNLAINSVTATNALSGLRVNDGVNLNGLIVTNSHFDGNVLQGWYLSEPDPGLGGMVTNVQVTNTTFNDNPNKGIYAEKLDNATFDGITINNSGTVGTNHVAGIDLNLKWAAYSNIQVLNSTITNNGKGDPNGGGILIKARSTGSYAGNPATLNGVVLRGLVVRGNGTPGTGLYAAGIRIGESNNSLTGADAGPTGVDISKSVIVGNATHGVRNATAATTVMARNNWWGCNAGPGNTGCDTVAGTVDFNPWMLLTASASPSAILPAGNSTITADMTTNSALATPSGGPLPSTPLSLWSATNGTMNPTSGTVTSGTANSLFTSNTPVNGTACATVDNQQVCTNIAIQVPPTVTTTAATLVTPNTATLNGSANPGGAATTGFFRYSTTSPGTCNDTFGIRAPASGGTALGAGNSAVPFSEAISGLLPSTTYFYCAIAQNSVGTGFGSVVQFTTPAAAPSVTTLAATPVTSTTATLNAVGTPNGATTTGWFRYSTTNPVTCDDTFGTRAPSSGGSALGSGTSATPFSQAITALLPGTTYYYCAIADNSVGTSFGAVLSFTTPAAQPVVTTNAATLVTTSTATLNGSANPGGAATTGWFRYATTSPGTCNDTFGSRAPTSGGSSLGSGNSTVPFSEALTGLADNTTYFYCAIAQNSIGLGFGTVMQFTTPPIIETGATSDAGGNIVITDANGGVSTDNVTLSRNTGNVRITSNDTVGAGGTCTQVNITTVDCPFVAGGSITVNSLAGNDMLTVDLSNGDVIPDGGISFNGGDPTTGPGDKLNIGGGSATTQTFNFTNEHDGSVVLSGLGTISYTGLEPVISTVDAANVVLNYSTATETITVSPDAGAPALTLVDSNVGGESVSFLNPTTSLEINGGDAAGVGTGDDTINVNGFGTSGGGFTAGLTINGGTGNDIVNIGASINFAPGNNLNVDLQDDNASPGVDQFNLTSGTLALTGTGSATIRVSQQATFVGSVSTVNGGITVEANQQLTPTAGNFRGVTVNTGTLTTSGTGNILVSGKGGDDGATTAHRGVFLTGGSITSTSAAAGAGTITINGRGGAGTTLNRGVEIFNSASVSSVVGDISITGFGSTAGTTTGNSGVVVNTTGAVNSTGSAKVTINGTGGSGTSSNHGVSIQNDNALVSSAGGDISIIGTGGAATATSNVGIVAANGARVQATGGAKIGLNGTAGTGTNFHFGVSIGEFNATTLVPTTITSDSGDITITGFGGTGSGFGQIGVNTANGGQIIAANAAKIAIAGTGGAGTSDNYGVGFDGANVAGTKVQSANGNIDITGTAGTSAGTDMDGVRFEDSLGVQPVSIITTGSGQLTVTGTGGNSNSTSSGIQIVDDTTMTLAGAANSFIADSMDIGSSAVSINAGANTMNIRQKTNGVAIDLGGPDVLSGGPLMLGLTDAELDRVTAGTINIGDANTGDIATTTAITRAAATAVNLTSGASVSISSGQIDSGGGNITTSPNAAAFLFVGNPGVDATTGAASTFKLATGRTLRLFINTPTVDTGYFQLNVAGQVDITGTNLVFGGGSTATPLAVYTIINNDSNDAITGEFAGYADGAVLTNFLGSGLNAVVDYQGGDGNDMTITMLPAIPEIQFSSATYIEDESQTATVTITRSGDLTNPSTVSFNAVAAGGATAGATCTPTADYAVIGTPLPRTLTFGTNVATQTVQFAVCGDSVIDPGEGLNLSLSGLTNATPGAQMTAVLDFNDTASRFLSTIPHEPIDMTLGSAAVPYASTITVAGAPNIIGGMRVTLYDIWHDTPDNIDVLLVGPQNQKYVLMADVGGPFSIGQGAPVTLTFSDMAPAVLGDSATLVTGLYRPTTCETPVLNFFGPAPTGPYVEPGCALARPQNKTLFGTPPTGFGMTNPNGTWRLFVRDDNGSLRPVEAVQTIVGSISGGWGLEFFAPTAADASISGRVLTADGRGIRGARVTVTGNSLSQPITVSTGVNGRYTIPGLTAGETYVVTVSARRFTFEAPSRVITLNDNVTDADFTSSAGTGRDQ